MDRAKRASAEAAKLAEELRIEQENSNQSDRQRKFLEMQLKVREMFFLNKRNNRIKSKVRESVYFLEIFYFDIKVFFVRNFNRRLRKPSIRRSRAALNGSRKWRLN